jgi:hypothetical protein
MKFRSNRSFKSKANFSLSLLTLSLLSFELEISTNYVFNCNLKCSIRCFDLNIAILMVP